MGCSPLNPGNPLAVAGEGVFDAEGNFFAGIHAVRREMGCWAQKNWIFL